MLKKMNDLITVRMVTLLMITIILSSCKHEPSNVKDLPTVCFEKEILPVFSMCAKCHNGGGEEGFDPSSYSSIMKSVKPGNPWGSKLYTIISSPNNPNMMPPKGYDPISKEDRIKVEVWILQGAKNTQCDSATTNGTQGNTQIDTICFSQDIMPIVKSSCAISSGTGVGCHDGTNGEARKFSDYNSLLPYINKTTPLNSKIYRAITGNGEDVMPPSPYSQLTTQQISNFKTWLSQGALNSDCAAIKGCDTTGTMSFASKVWPIIQNNCLGCHGTVNPSGNVSLASYDLVKSKALELRNSVPVLIGAIKQLPNFKAMPPTGKLTLCQIRTMELWVDQSMPQ
jgi:hypothetical protein